MVNVWANNHGIEENPSETWIGGAKNDAMRSMHAKIIHEKVDIDRSRLIDRFAFVQKKSITPLPVANKIKIKIKMTFQDSGAA